MEVNALMIAVFVAVLVFMGYMGLTAYIEKKKTSKELRDRLQESTAYGVDVSHNVYQDSLTQSDGSSSEESGLVSFCYTILRMLGVNIANAKEKLGAKLLMAGYRGETPLIIFLFFQRVVGAVLLVFAALFALGIDDPQDDLVSVLITFLLVVGGLMGPNIFLTNAIQKQKQALTRSFPDTLDLILVCIEAGLALDAALAKVCSELGTAHPEMTNELDRMRLEFSMLDDRSRALVNFAERTDVPSIRSLVAALVQSEKFGTPLSQSLRVLAEDYRTTRLMLAEQKAGKIPAIITVPTIFMMLPALFIIILGPTIIISMQGGGLFSAMGEARE